MLSVEQIGSQYWLVMFDEEKSGQPYVIEGPFQTKEAAEMKTSIRDV